MWRAALMLTASTVGSRPGRAAQVYAYLAPRAAPGQEPGQAAGARAQGVPGPHAPESDRSTCPPCMARHGSAPTVSCAWWAMCQKQALLGVHSVGSGQTRLVGFRQTKRRSCCSTSFLTRCGKL